MPVTAIQRDICAILAATRRKAGESYVAGFLAINVLLDGRRYSEDIDLFHETEEALASSWSQDREELLKAGFTVNTVRESTYLVRADVSRGNETTTLDWANDSAFRFFPLVEHEQLGLALHPFDLATNKVLALVGRLYPRDWIDLILCCDRLQPLGYLAWAAAGKDPGLSPTFILTEARRSSRYTQVELNKLEYDGEPADAAYLGAKWRTMLEEADRVVALLPAEHVGEALLDSEFNLLRAGYEDLEKLLANDSVRFHAGRIKGAFPVLRS